MVTWPVLNVAKTEVWISDFKTERSLSIKELLACTVKLY